MTDSPDFTPTAPIPQPTNKYDFSEVRRRALIDMNSYAPVPYEQAVYGWIPPFECPYAILTLVHLRMLGYITIVFDPDANTGYYTITEKGIQNAGRAALESAK